MKLRFDGNVAKRRIWFSSLKKNCILAFWPHFNKCFGDYLTMECIFVTLSLILTILFAPIWGANLLLKQKILQMQISTFCHHHQGRALMTTIKIYRKKYQRLISQWYFLSSIFWLQIKLLFLHFFFHHKSTNIFSDVNKLLLSVRHFIPNSKYSLSFDPTMSNYSWNY